MSKNHGRLALILFAILLCASAPAFGQLQASGQIITNSFGANVTLLASTPLYPNPVVTSFSISTPANLSGCTTQQPQVALISGLQLSLTTLTNGNSSWTNNGGLPMTVLPGAGHNVIASLLTPGDGGCANELPITVTITYSPGPPAPPLGNLVTTAQIATNVLGTSANLYAGSYLYPNASLTGLVISTTSNLTSCSTQPQITFYVGGSAINTTTLTNGTNSWPATGGLPHAVGPLITVSAVLSQAGIGCSGELPITITATIALGAVGTVPVSFNVSDVGGSPGTTVKARFTLVNCGSNTPSIGNLTLSQNIKDLTSNGSGLISGGLYPTDAIQCAAQQSTYYILTFLVNGVPNQVTGLYLIQSGPGTFNPANVPLCQAGVYAEFCALIKTPPGPIMVGPSGPPGPPGSAGTGALPTGSGNKIVGSPADGSSGPSTLRSMVPADIPANITSNTSGNAATASNFDHVPTDCSGYAHGVDAAGNCVGDPVSSQSNVVVGIWPKTVAPATDCIPIGGGSGACVGVDSGSGLLYCIKTSGASCFPSGMTWPSGGQGVPYYSGSSSWGSTITPSGTKCYPFMGSGGTGCDSPTGSGIISATLPALLFNPSTCSGPTCNFAFTATQAGYFLRGAQSSSQLPVVVQVVTCKVLASAAPTCVFPTSSAANWYGISIGTNAGSNPVTSVVDTGSADTFSHATGVANQSDLELYYAENVAGGARTITVNLNASHDTVIVMYEVANMKLSGSLDGSPSGTAGACSGGFFAIGSSVTSNANDIIFALGADQANPEVLLTVGPGFTLNGQDTVNPGRSSTNVQYMTVNSAGTYPGSFGCTGTTAGVMQAFKGATTAPSQVWNQGPVVPSDVAPIAIGPIYNHSGIFQNVLPHTVVDSCTLGTNCSVTLTGAAIFSSSTSYSCQGTDETAAAAVKFAPSSGSAFALTGTGTDVISYVCTGD